MWRGTACKPEYISSVLTEMGRCYTFNGNPDDVLFADKTGRLNVVKVLKVPYEQVNCFGVDIAMTNMGK